MAMTLLPQDTHKANSILDEMLTYTNKDGIIMTYFDTKRPRIDPIVCVNAVRFFYKYSRGESTPALEPTKSWISDVLFHRAYVDGTYYYPTGEVFLYLFSRLLLANSGSDIYRRTSSLLRERLQERVGTAGDALELALRLIACVDMGVQNEVDLKRLESMQEEDGAFPIGWLCQTGKISLRIGNKGVTTAFAVKAIEKAREDKSEIADGFRLVVPVDSELMDNQGGRVFGSTIPSLMLGIEASATQINRCLPARLWHFMSSSWDDISSACHDYNITGSDWLTSIPHAGCGEGRTTS